MSRERRLPEQWEAYLGPVAMAQFIEGGWIKQWPMSMTEAGQHAIKGSGFGIWRGPGRTEQSLPFETTPSERGAAYWEGRRA